LLITHHIVLQEVCNLEVATEPFTVQPLFLED